MVTLLGPVTAWGEGQELGGMGQERAFWGEEAVPDVVGGEDSTGGHSARSPYTVTHLRRPYCALLPRCFQNQVQQPSAPPKTTTDFKHPHPGLWPRCHLVTQNMPVVGHACASVPHGPLQLTSKFLLGHLLLQEALPESSQPGAPLPKP